VPKSASASITHNVTPAAIAGRATGSATRKNTAAGPRPSVRAASTTPADWPANAARAVA